MIENNYESLDVKEQMVDADNYDFRPIAGGGFDPCPNTNSADWCNERCNTERRCTRRNNCQIKCQQTCGLCEMIGAYSIDSPTYWIPGRKLYKASFPIPQDGGTAPADRVDVICQTGFRADQHNFYFGDNIDDVKSAGKEDENYRLTLSGEENVFPLPISLTAGKEYYWRVDAQRGDDVYKGDIWSFIAA